MTPKILPERRMGYIDENGVYVPLNRRQAKTFALQLKNRLKESTKIVNETMTRNRLKMKITYDKKTTMLFKI